jgi:uncharacterized membrane protein required for colicin V production
MKEKKMNLFLDRMFRAAKLDVKLYEEVEADKTAMGQAMGVVILSSLATGVGIIPQTGISGILLAILAALAGWFLWAFLTYFIGTKLLAEPQTRVDYGQLLLTIGFSSSPGLIRLLGIIPGLAAIILVFASVWMLIAMVVAVRQALDYSSTLRAAGGVALSGGLSRALF